MAEKKEKKNEKVERTAKGEKTGEGGKAGKAERAAGWRHLKYPYLTEKSVSLVERTNTIAFVVDLKANKKQIKEEFEKIFEVKVAGVNTEITSDGKKKAFIKLRPEFNAADVATKLGVV